MNIAFNYQYRDASNFKRSAQVIFSNSNSWELEAINLAFEQATLHGEFIADQISIPELFFDKRHFSGDDHCFHEFVGMEHTDMPSNDRHRRSISEFLTDVKHAHESGWLVFDPWEREYEQSLNRRIA